MTDLGLIEIKVSPKKFEQPFGGHLNFDALTFWSYGISTL